MIHDVELYRCIASSGGINVVDGYVMALSCGRILLLTLEETLILGVLYVCTDAHVCSRSYNFTGLGY